MAETPTEVASSSILTNPDYGTLPILIQCCTCSEVNKALSTTSELVIVTNKIVKWDDKETELVIVGKDSVHFSNSELVMFQ